MRWLKTSRSRILERTHNNEDAHASQQEYNIDINRGYTSGIVHCRGLVRNVLEVWGQSCPYLLLLKYQEFSGRICRTSSSHITMPSQVTGGVGILESEGST